MYTLYHIEEMTVVKELVKRVENVFAERLKLESPFVSALTACIRAFLLPKISGLNLFKRCYGVKRQALAAGTLPNRPEKVPHDCFLPESDRPARPGNATLTMGEIPYHKIRSFKRRVR